MKAKKILFITQEMTPYVPDSELAAMGRELPQEIQEKGREIRTFMPKWGNINERRNQLHEVIRLSGMNLIIDDTDHPLIIKVASIQAARMQVYFIDNDDYFLKRLMALDENGKEYEDNSERAIFYARGVLETVKKLRWVPDVIHCQGWMSALVPLYVKTAYKEEPSFRDSKIVYSMSSEGLKQSMGTNFGNCITFRDVNASVLEDFSPEVTYDELNKLAINYSDGPCPIRTSSKPLPNTHKANRFRCWKTSVLPMPMLLPTSTTKYGARARVKTKNIYHPPQT